MSTESGTTRNADIPDQRIVTVLRDSYGLMTRAISLLAAGADVNALRYRVVADEGDFFLKLRPRAGIAAALELQRFLADHAQARVLAPVRAKDDQLSTHLGAFVAVLYPFVAGPSGFQVSLRNDQWQSFGATLRSIHDVAVPDSLGRAIRAETFGSRWRDKVRTLLIETTTLGRGDAPAQEFSEAMAARHGQIETILDRAAELAAAVVSKSLPPVLCHGDLHAGNVIVGGDGLLTLVDWDDPVMAPRERDLMFVGGGVGGVWNNEQESEAFYRGYGPAAVDPAAVAYFRCERIIQDIAEFSDELLGGHDEVARDLSLRHFLDQFEPNNVAEIADRTYAALSWTADSNTFPL